MSVRRRNVVPGGGEHGKSNNSRGIWLPVSTNDFFLESCVAGTKPVVWLCAAINVVCIATAEFAAGKLVTY